jgi:alcohol dehydrogenase (cytochrome c)
MQRLSIKATLLAASFAALAAASALAQERALRPVTDAMLQNPEPGQWLSWRRTLNHWGYSPLTQIDKRNVAQLKLVWTRPIAQGVQEGTPLVHDGVLFFPNPNDITQAIDAATGDLIWEYRRPVQDDNAEYIPFPSINRNLAIHGHLILDNGADNYASMVLFLYNKAFGQVRFGYASAIAWVLFAIIISFTLLFQSLSKHWVYYEGEQG